MSGTYSSVSPLTNMGRARSSSSSHRLSPDVQRVDAPIRRRRRRILSCDTCRRLKCRCVIERRYEACVRCRHLQLQCSKSRNIPEPTILSSNSEAESSRPSIVTQPAHQSPGSFVSDGRRQFSRSELGQTRNHDQNSEQYDVVNPVDHRVGASPAEVIRKVGRQLNGGQRRTFERRQDLVTRGIIDEAMSTNLLDVSTRMLQQTIPVDETGELRLVSPFLHAVYCLTGIRWSKHVDSEPSELHREIYETVRQMLGDLMLVTPLPVAELTGILIMALYASSPTRGPEYIDSWLLSGHCAQQAMLSINFSDIATRVENDMATASDHRALRLWANTCLVNLHWGATAGRPPTVPALYLDQCKLLLKFQQATLRDGMLVAEIKLFTILHDRIAAKQALDSDGGSTQLAAWKSDWGHLLNLPTSWQLKMGHSAAWLLLARRTVEARKESLDQDLLNPVSDQEAADSQNLPLLVEAERILYESAVSVLRIFVAASITTKDAAPEFYLSCLAYSLLVLSKYDGALAETSHLQVFNDLELLNEYYRNSVTVSSAIEFGLTRALSKLEQSQ